MALAKKLHGFQFGDKPIRCVGTDRDLWFCAKDVCEALGIVWKGNDSLGDILPEWRGVRNFRTPIIDTLGHQRFTETEMVAIAEPAVYQLAARSHKPIAREFQRWLFNEVLPSIRKTGAYAHQRRKKYESLGKSPEWIDERLEGIEERKEFTKKLQKHGVEGGGYGACTNAIYVPLFGDTAAHLRMKRKLPKKTDIRDSLSKIELAKLKLSEMLATERITAEDSMGTTECAGVCRHAARSVADATTNALTAPIIPALG